MWGSAVSASEPQLGVEGAEPLGPAPHLLLALLGRDVEARAARRRPARPAMAAAGWTCRCRARRRAGVTEPGTRPPPSTRSSSATPVGTGRAPPLSTSAMGAAPRWRAEPAGQAAPPSSGEAGAASSSSTRRVPRLARRAPPRPRGALPAALGAPVHRLHLRHGATVQKGCHRVADGRRRAAPCRAPGHCRAVASRRRSRRRSGVTPLAYGPTMREDRGPAERRPSQGRGAAAAGRPRATPRRWRSSRGASGPSRCARRCSPSCWPTGPAST